MFVTIKTARLYISSRRILTLLLAIGIFYGLYSEGFDRLWTAHLIEDFNATSAIANNPILFMGIVRMVLIILSILALAIVDKKLNLKSTKGIIRVLSFCVIIIIFSLIGFSLLKNLYLVLLLVCIIGIMRSITSPLLETCLNNQILNQNIRATIFSVKGQIDSISQIAGGPIVGFIGNIFSIRITLFASAIILSPIIYYIVY